MPDIASAIGDPIQFKGVAGCTSGGMVKKEEPHSGGVAAENRKVCAGSGYGRAKGHWLAGCGFNVQVMMDLSAIMFDSSALTHDAGYKPTLSENNQVVR